MPRAAPKPCTAPGCGRAVFDGTSRCPQHPYANRFADERRGTRQKRGYGADWDRKRPQILTRDRGLCQPCLHGISFVDTGLPLEQHPGLWSKPSRVTLAREVDHKVCKAAAQRLGWSRAQMDDERNLWSICGLCHPQKTALEGHGGMFTSLLSVAGG